MPLSADPSIEIRVERTVLVLGKLIVEGWCSAPELPDCLRLGGRAGDELRAARGLRHARPDVGLALAHRGLDPAFGDFGFTAVIDLDADHLGPLAAGEGTHRYGGPGGHWVELGPLRTLGRLGRFEPQAQGVVERAVEHGLLDDAAAVALVRAAASPGGGSAATGEAQVDLHGVGERAVGVEFWLQDAAARRPVLASEDLSWMLAPEELLFSPRPDVTAHLRDKGLPVATDRHGVIAVMPLFRGRPHEIVIGVTGGDGSVAVRTLEIAPGEGDAGSLASRALAREPATARIADLLRPLLAGRPAVPVWQAERWRPSDGAPDMSAVVVVGAGGMPLQAVLMMLARLPWAGEWILVCDDPARATEVRNAVARRQRTFCAPVTLVTTERRQGRWRAVGIGAGISRGDLLLLMDEAVWLENLDAIEAAATDIRSGAVGLAGFRLLFEDGTLAGDGLRLTDGVIEALGRGLPPTPPGQGAQDVEAVSGALLLMARDLWVQLGGLSDDYLSDGEATALDFVMRARTAGHRIGLYQDQPARHLQRRRNEGGVAAQVDRGTFAARWAPPPANPAG